MNNNAFLITGGAGFIGFHLSKKLLEQGYTVIGYDNLNDYYDTSLKDKRIKILEQNKDYLFYKADVGNYELLEKVVKEHDIQFIVNLAAQAGVRYSLTNPRSYIDSNIIGMFNVLEVCRNCKVKHLLYASSSSVYGSSKEEKFKEDQKVDFPISLYAATKKSNELFAHVYSNNFSINTIGLRFFTVYGPYGRPDMAYYGFTEKILRGDTIDVYNYGNQYRDFTYIDDLIDGIDKIIHIEMKKDINGYYEIFNIGNGKPVKLMDFINNLEKVIGKKAKLNFTEKVIGDVEKTFADISMLHKLTGYQPNTSINEGLQKFYTWYKGFYNIEEC